MTLDGATSCAGEIFYLPATSQSPCFVSNKRLCGNRVNFLLSMRKVSLWLTSTFSRRFSKQVLHARATRQLNHFLILPMKTFSCFKFQGNISWDGCTLVNFLLTTVSPFCPIRGRGFVKMKQTLQMWRAQRKSHAYHQRAHFLTTARSWSSVYQQKLMRAL